MKKKILIPIGVILVVAVVAVVYYLTPKTFGMKVSSSDVDHIDVFDGNTGKEFTISNPEDVQYIVENIKSHSMRRDGISLGRTGYGFRITYFDSNDKEVISTFILNGGGCIRKDPFFYRCDGGLCYDYIKSLEK